MWDKMEAALDTGKHSEDFIQSKQLKAKFYYSRVLPRIESLFSLIEQFPADLSRRSKAVLIISFLLSHWI